MQESLRTIQSLFEPIRFNLVDMHSRDFLHKHAETHLREYYYAAGAVCSLSTNYEQVLEAARGSFSPVEMPPEPVDFSLRFWVDNSDPGKPPWPKPYVRGLDHQVFVGFDVGSSIVADLRTRRVIGRFAPAMAADSAYWGAVIFPMLLTIVSASLGVAELHCACVSKNENGILLAGPSRSGKSTLALALSQAGCSFLSDDRTFCSVNNEEVQAWGLPTRLKLRPEADQWFEELHEKPVTDAQDPAFWLEPERLAGVRRVRRCRPTWLLFLERRDASAFELSPISSAEALSRLNGELMAELPDAAAKRSGTIKKIAELPCWLLEYGGDPRAIARQIIHHVAESSLVAAGQEAGRQA